MTTFGWISIVCEVYFLVRLDQIHSNISIWRENEIHVRLISGNVHFESLHLLILHLLILEMY